MVIKCTKCDTELRIDAKFCDGCGSRIKIVYPDITCPKCGGTWTPRKANPKYCTKCGYDLRKDDTVIVYAQDMGGYSMNTGRCVGLYNPACKKQELRFVGHMCGKETNLYMRVKLPNETDRKVRCYPCMMEYMKKATELNSYDGETLKDLIEME